VRTNDLMQWLLDRGVLPTAAQWVCDAAHATLSGNRHFTGSLSYPRVTVREGRPTRFSASVSLHREAAGFKAEPARFIFTYSPRTGKYRGRLDKI
jgi:hypothetical protein